MEHEITTQEDAENTAGEASDELLDIETLIENDDFAGARDALETTITRLNNLRSWLEAAENGVH